MKTITYQLTAKLIASIILISFLSINGLSQSSILTANLNIYSPEATMGITEQELGSNELLALNTDNYSDNSLDLISDDSFTLLAVEFEREIEIEEWMLNDFEYNLESQKLNNLIKHDSESDQKIEDWMVNLDTW